MTDAVAIETSTARERSSAVWLTAFGYTCLVSSVSWALFAALGQVHARRDGPAKPTPASAHEPESSFPLAQTQREPATTSDAGMSRIPAGRYRPFYKGKDSEEGIAVKAFLLDTLPVSPPEFLEFVRQRGEWRKSAVKRLFAEPSYLADWGGDLLPSDVPAQTFVSWFAARAYCKYRGKRLPTLVEWELAAAPSRTADNVAGDEKTPFRFAMGPAGGSGPSFGSIWEWTLDFNGSLVSGKATPDDDGVAALFCGAGAKAVDASDYGAFLRYSFRSSLRANYALKNLGFRCAKDAP